MLDNNWTWNDLLDALKTKDGIAGLNPNAYAFGLCFAQLNDKQKKEIAQLVNTMENKKENN